MAHVRGSIVASQAKWEATIAGLSTELRGPFLRIIDLIAEFGLEGLPSSISRRVRDNVWEICIRGPSKFHVMQIVSEAHGDVSCINRHDGKIGLPADIRGRLLRSPKVHAAWLRADSDLRIEAVFALLGMEEDDSYISRFIQ